MKIVATLFTTCWISSPYNTNEKQTCSRKFVVNATGKHTCVGAHNVTIMGS